MRRSKFAPRLNPIDEDLTASMIKHGSKAVNTQPRSSRGTSKPRSTRGTAQPHKSRGLEVVRTQPPAETATEKNVESVENAAEPVTLEPIRNRANTAPTATAPAVVVRTPSSSVGNKYNRSPLHDAVRKGDIVTVKRLVVEQPELLHRADIRGNHPLHYAASATGAHTAEIVYVLLKAGASVNAVNERQQTPLLIHVIASTKDDDAIVRILLHHNAKAMIQMAETLTLSHFAASRGFHKIAAVLNECM